MQRSDLWAWYRNLDIRSKLLLGYAAVLMFFLCVSALVIYPIIRSTILTNIESDLNNTTKMIQNAVRSTADASIKNYLRAVAEKNLEIVTQLYKMYEQGLLSEAEARKRAEAILLSQHIGKTGYIYCLDSKGIIRLHPVAALLGADLTKHAFIQQQLKDKVGYIEYEWKNPGETVLRRKALYMTYFAPWDWIISASSYRDEFSQLVNVDNFRNSILSIRFGNTGYPFIMDSKGNLIIHPYLEGKNIYNAKDATGRAFMQEMCSRKNGRINYPWRNPKEEVARDKLVTFSFIPEYDWIVASSSYMEEFYAPLNRIRRVLIVIFIITMSILTLVTVFYSTYIVRSLDKLVAGFSSGGTDLSARMQVDSKDEFGKLAEGFNIFMGRMEIYNLSLKNEIARRREMENELRDANEKYRSVLRAATGFSIIGTDSQGVIRVFNEGAELMLGYKAEEVIDQATPAIFYDQQEIAERARELGIAPGVQVLVQVASRGGTETREWTNIRKDGSRFPGQLSVTARRDSSGNIIGFLGIGLDITERRQAQEGLKKMNESLEQRVQERTRQLEESNCRLEEEVLERADAEESLRKAYNELKVMQSQLLQAAKMASVGQLAAGVAHEINNPTSFLVSNLEVLSLRFPSLGKLIGLYDEMSACVLRDDMAAAQEKLRQIVALREEENVDFVIKDLPALLSESLDGAKRIQKIVADLRTFSHCEEGIPQEADLNNLIDAALNIASNELKYKAQVVKEYSDLPPVSCYEQRLGQVFLNLLVNAAQAIETQGEITIRTYQQGKYYCVDIADNGCGMSEEVQKHLFEPFFTTKPAGKGTGLGLSLAYNIIEQHNGQIEVESKPGVGTTFTIMLPAAEQQEEGSEG